MEKPSPGGGPGWEAGTSTPAGLAGGTGAGFILLCSAARLTTRQGWWEQPPGYRAQGCPAGVHCAPWGAVLKFCSKKKSVCLMLVLASARMALFLPDETKCLSICSYAKDICPAGHLLPVLGGSICNLENELNVHFIWNYKHKQLQKCNLSLLREGQQAIEKHATSPW